MQNTSMKTQYDQTLHSPITASVGLTQDDLNALNEVVQLAEGIDRIDSRRYSPRFKSVIRRARIALDSITLHE